MILTWYSRKKINIHIGTICVQMTKHMKLCVSACKFDVSLIPYGLLICVFISIVNLPMVIIHIKTHLKRKLGPPYIPMWTSMFKSIKQIQTGLYRIDSNRSKTSWTDLNRTKHNHTQGAGGRVNINFLAHPYLVVSFRVYNP